MFAFYDFETTGISPAFDQPLQFAAILVDDEFQEIEGYRSEFKDIEAINKIVQCY